MKKTLALTAALMLTLTACSSGESPAPAATPTPSETTAQAADTATIEQYLVELTPVARSVEEWRQDWKDSTCSALIVDEDPLCSAQISTASMIGGTVEATAEGAMKPGVPAYIGAPPAHVEGLLEETIEAGKEVSELGDEWRSDDCPDGETCARVAMDITRGMDKLGDLFASWDVYK